MDNVNGRKAGMAAQETEAAPWSQQREIEAGLLLVHTDYVPTRPLREHSVHADGAGALVMTIGLDGESAYTARDGTQLRFRRGHTTVSAFRHSSGERSCEAGQRVAQLRVIVAASVLQRYWPWPEKSLLPDDGVVPLAYAPTTPAASAQVCSLLRSNDALAVHIGVLSLLAEQLGALQPAAASAPRWREDDIARLERVYALMQELMAQELTLDYLCAQVGMSLFKLKQGWRYRYNSTPYQSLLALRMQRAQQLLEGGCQVAQAGWQVGYRHPSNFSTAYTRFFGRTPKTTGRAPP